MPDTCGEMESKRSSDSPCRPQEYWRPFLHVCSGDIWGYSHTILETS
jgi:hypothetical protein